MKIRFISAALLLILLNLPPVYSQPFWTEKSTYSDGEFLFAVGIATDVRNKEDGRIEAFDNGVREICKLMGVGELPDLEIRTQMTYEEEHEDGTYTIYRLLRTKEDALKTAVRQKQASISSASAYAKKVEPYAEVWPGGHLKIKGYKKRIGGTPIRTGKWIWWYEDGKKKGEENYKDGLRHGESIYWYENGLKKSEFEFRDGKQHGKWSGWYESGQKLWETEFRDGISHGKQTTWDKKGQKQTEGN